MRPIYIILFPAHAPSALHREQKARIALQQIIFATQSLRADSPPLQPSSETAAEKKKENLNLTQAGFSADFSPKPCCLCPAARGWGKQPEHTQCFPGSSQILATNSWERHLSSKQREQEDLACGDSAAHPSSSIQQCQAPLALFGGKDSNTTHSGL